MDEPTQVSLPSAGSADSESNQMKGTRLELSLAACAAIRASSMVCRPAALEPPDRRRGYRSGRYRSRIFLTSSMGRASTVPWWPVTVVARSSEL